MDKPRSCIESVNDFSKQNKAEQVSSNGGIAIDAIRKNKKLEALTILLENDEIWEILQSLDEYKTFHKLIAVELIERRRGASVACYLPLLNVDHSLVADLLIKTGRADAIGLHWENFTKLDRSYYKKKLQLLNVSILEKDSSR